MSLKTSNSAAPADVVPAAQVPDFVRRWAQRGKKKGAK